MKKFGLIGVGGYIAPRHLQAIKETGNELLVALDINDSVGVMDRYFPESEFFTEFEQFEAFIEDQKFMGQSLDFISICSPNYLHLPHMKFALRHGIDVICEKPLVLESSDLNILQKYEAKFGARVNSILQLRLHPAILELRNKVLSSPDHKTFDVELTYLTSRGKWYMRSWKGLDQKSGGVATNIGVHFYDMLQFIFGPIKDLKIYHRDDQTCSGYLEFAKARVKWFLSIDATNLPQNAIKGEKTTFRSILIEGEELEFSGGFTDLHTQSYEEIISGNGFDLNENRPAIEIVEKIRNEPLCAKRTLIHPLLATSLR